MAYIEQRWAPVLRRTTLYRYELPSKTFEPLHDAGMWVSRRAVRPLATRAIENLPHRLEEEDVELRALERLTTLRDVWETTLHASGVRLRNAQGWC